VLLTRSLYSASEPTACLRPGERIVGVIEQGDTMSEYVIGRDAVTRRDVLRLMDLVIESGMFPPGTRALRRPRKRVGTARHSGRMSKRRR
jgi:hypothetical protein